MQNNTTLLVYIITNIVVRTSGLSGVRMDSNNLDNIITAALAIEEQDAKQADAIGYMARVLVQVTMPHSAPNSLSFERSNGKLNLAMTAHPKVGLPYGVYPRLLLAWLATEAVRKNEQTIILGNSLSEFMHKLSLIPSGGRWGTIARLRQQMRKLFSASVHCIYNDQKSYGGLGFNIASEYHLWWDPKQPHQADLWQSTVKLSYEFFNEIIRRPVPIDMRVLKAIKSSSMAIDLYCWLTYRFSYLRHKTEIPWVLLQKQFGANYADTKQGRHQFKRKLKTQLKKVLAVYKDAGIGEGDNGLILLPSKPHINKL